MASVYYVGFGVGGLVNFPVPDLIGRKKAMLIYGTVSLIAQLAMIFSGSYWIRLIAFGFFGGTCIKNAISYVWMMELVESKHKSTALAMINAFDEFSPFVFCFYIKYINKDWFPLVSAMTFISVVAFLITITLLPESPKLLLLQGRTDEAIKALNKLAWLNCAKNRIPTDAIFVESLVAGNLDHTVVLNRTHETIASIIADTSRRAFGRPDRLPSNTLSLTPASQDKEGFIRAGLTPDVQ